MFDPSVLACAEVRNVCARPLLGCDREGICHLEARDHVAPMVAIPGLLRSDGLRYFTRLGLSTMAA
jgi:hypothetical protein